MISLNAFSDKSLLVSSNIMLDENDVSSLSNSSFLDGEVWQPIRTPSMDHAPGEGEPLALDNQFSH